MSIPIFFVHGGKQEYLKVPISQARSLNSNVILLGDIPWGPDSIDADWYQVSDYLNTADVQKFLQSYRHMSTNDPRIELICFLRWFAIKNFMESTNLKECFYVDSDVMTYFNADQVASEYSNNGAGLLMPEFQEQYRWVASGHTSYWKLPTLQKLCAFMVETYSNPEKLAKLTEKHTWHNKNNKPGGVVDMTLLYLFAVEYWDSLKLINFSEINNGSAFDDNLNSAENFYQNEYSMHQNKKKIKWDADIPFCYNNNTKKWVKFRSLHFQGGLKDKIRILIDQSKKDRNV